MNEDRIEIIKAFAAGMDIEDIANFAGISVEEAEEFAKVNSQAIEDRKKIMEDKGEI